MQSTVEKLLSQCYYIWCICSAFSILLANKSQEMELSKGHFTAFFCTRLSPFQLQKKSVGSRMAAASHVDHNSSAHLTQSGRLRTNAVIYNWKGLKLKSYDLKLRSHYYLKFTLHNGQLCTCDSNILFTSF